MSTHLVSFIIPAYNASRTIHRCLDSIYSLSLNDSDFEVIVIDDCSTDDMRDVILKYCTTHPQVRLICQPENRRQGAARNRAIPLAQGDYITFVDADDYVEKGMGDALKKAKDSNVDLLICQTRAKGIDGTFVYHHLDKNVKGVITGKTFCEEHYHWHLPGAPWGYIFRKDYIQSSGIYFIENHLHEDCDWILKHIYNAHAIAICEELIYTYVYTLGSTVDTINYKRIADSIYADCRVMCFAKSVCHEAPLFTSKCIDDRSYSVRGKLIRLWKLEDREFLRFYQYLGDSTRKTLLKVGNHKIYGSRVITLLSSKYLSIFLLYLFAIPLQLIRKYL